MFIVSRSVLFTQTEWRRHVLSAMLMCHLWFKKNNNKWVMGWCRLGNSGLYSREWSLGSLASLSVQLCGPHICCHSPTWLASSCGGTMIYCQRRWMREAAWHSTQRDVTSQDETFKKKKKKKKEWQEKTRRALCNDFYSAEEKIRRVTWQMDFNLWICASVVNFSLANGSRASLLQKVSCSYFVSFIEACPI